MEGEVKWFNDERGFGFISCKGQDYFAHFKEVQGTGYKSLKEGEKVSFEPAISPKGNIAKSIVKLG